jgi:hypothetical protein
MRSDRELKLFASQSPERDGVRNIAMSMTNPSGRHASPIDGNDNNMGDSLASSDDHNRTAQPRAVRDVLADVRDQVIKAFTGPFFNGDGSVDTPPIIKVGVTESGSVCISAQRVVPSRCGSSCGDGCSISQSAWANGCARHRDADPLAQRIRRSGGLRARKSGPDGGRFERRARRSNAGHPWLVGPAYGFGAETRLHALRLTGSGLFDAFPKLTIILGHLGEGLPFNLFRIDERIRWSPLGYPAKKQISQYFAENSYMTTRVLSAPKRW